MFRGVSTLNLDAKGRLAIPTRYRDRLREDCDSQLVVTIDPDRCLLIYPHPEWVTVERRIMALPTFDKSSRALQRLLVGHATEVEMDAQGRVLLPPPLRQVAGLEKQVVLSGQLNRFELWDEALWNERRQQWMEEVSLEHLNLPAGAENISI